HMLSAALLFHTAGIRPEPQSRNQLLLLCTIEQIQRSDRRGKDTKKSEEFAERQIEKKHRYATPSARTNDPKIHSSIERVVHKPTYRPAFRSASLRISSA